MVPTSALIEAFVSLAPLLDVMNVHTAVFHKQSKVKGKGQSVRCIQRKRNISTTAIDNDESYTGGIVLALEIGNVDSVDKVCRILTEHMRLGVSAHLSV